jgi:hypothetical protein
MGETLAARAPMAGRARTAWEPHSPAVARLGRRQGMEAAEPGEEPWASAESE